METLFIEAKSNIDFIDALKRIKLKGKVGLVTTIQHLHKLKGVQKIVPNSVLGGQILGCDVSAAMNIKDKVDFFLYIGSGEFHPMEVALKTSKEVTAFNPFTEKTSKITKKDIETMRKNIKGKYLRFLAAEKIGILVSTKPGQYNLQKALELQKKLKKPSYILIFNTLTERELENYPGINIFVNTSCPRIDFKKVINLMDLEEMIKIFS